MLKSLLALKASMGNVSITAVFSVVIVFFLLVSAIFFPLRLLLNAPAVKSVEGELGYASLMDEEYSTGAIKLVGEWEFYPNCLYNFDDFTYGRAITPRYVRFPQYWRDEPENIIKNSAYATYRMRVRVPASFDGIGIYSREQSSAYDIYINGAKICGAGIVNADSDEYEPAFLPSSGHTYSASAIGDQGRTFSIIVHIQNDSVALGGFTDEILIGSVDSVRQLSTVLLISNGLISGGFLLLFFCFTVTFLSGRQRREYLYYTIVALLSFFLSLTLTGERLMYSSGLDNVLISKLEYCALLNAAFFANYSTIKSIIKSRKAFLTLRLCVLGATLFLLFAPLMLSSSMRTPLNIICVGFFIPPFIIAVKNIGKNYVSIASTLSYLFIFAGIYMAFYSSFISNNIFAVSVMIHCVLQMMLFLFRYSKVERELKDMTETLEQRIDARTLELTIMKEKAEAATIAKSNFLATMSHEIRTPMNGIMGIADIMRTDNLDEVQRGYLIDIKKSAKALLQIINDILDFSKIEAGKLTINPSNFSLMALFDNICSICRFSAVAKGLEFRHGFAPDVPLYVYADETRYRQVIINVINNAVKYTFKGYILFEVSVLEREGKKYLCFMVTDSGIGIKPENIDKLFSSFEQLDGQANRKIEGTGLGLPITKHLVELMDGMIEVESEYQVGSCFSILLPLVEGDANKADSKAVYEPVSADGVNVLVVDDIDINLTVAQGFLCMHGILPDTAKSGEEAIRKIKEKHYDLVFMDHMMPEMDGYEATKIIKQDERFKDLPIVALTANAVTGAKDLLKESGMVDFLSKPIDAHDLNNILIKYLPAQKLDRGSRADGDNTPVVSLDSLEGIPGLDMSEGLKNSANSESAYMLILRQFCADIEEYLQGIKTSFNDNRFDDYRAKLHAIKGILATIGATGLSKRAQELFDAPVEDDLSILSEQTKSLTDETRELKENIIGTGILENKKDAGKVTQISGTELSEKLKKLREYFMTGDCNESEELICSLECMSFNKMVDDELTQIFALARSFDYFSAVEKTDVLLSRLS